MRTNLILLAVALLCFTLAACATPAQTAAAVTAVGSTAVAMIDALAPLLPPETLAKLQATAHTIDGTVQATATAVGTIADAIAQVKTNASQQFAAQAEGLQKAMMQLQTLPSREEVYLTGAGTGAASTAASRWLSAARRARELATAVARPGTAAAT